MRRIPANQSLSYPIRFPDAAGRWRRKWAEPEMVLSLPDPVVERLQGGAPLAPVLREISEPGGTRYAVLDFIIEVPVQALAEPMQIQRVLGWDGGVRTLVTATALDLSGNRLAPPCSWTRVALTGDKLTPNGTSIGKLALLHLCGPGS